MYDKEKLWWMLEIIIAPIFLFFLFPFEVDEWPVLLLLLANDVTGCIVAWTWGWVWEVGVGLWRGRGRGESGWGGRGWGESEEEKEVEVRSEWNSRRKAIGPGCFHRCWYCWKCPMSSTVELGCSKLVDS